MSKRPILALSLLLSACHAEPAPRAATVAESSGASADPFADELGGVASAPATQGHSSAIATLGITPPDSPWSTMSTEDREMYMIGKVLPIMKELFATHDSTRYHAFGCETCHGTEMEQIAFRMPPRSALPVPPRGTPEFARLEREFPDSVRFMEETVTPTMKTLLGATSYSCNNCHPSAATH